MKKLIIIALVASLGGCASLQNAWNVMTSVQVTPQAVTIAGNSFDALEATATNYLRLPKCTGTNGPACRDPATARRIISAVRTGRVARADLEQFFIDHPGQLGPQGLYDAFSIAIQALQTNLAGAQK